MSFHQSVASDVWMYLLKLRILYLRWWMDGWMDVYCVGCFFCLSCNPYHSSKCESLGDFTVRISIKLSTNFVINYVTNSCQQADFNSHPCKLHLRVSFICIYIYMNASKLYISVWISPFHLERTYNLIWWGTHVHLCICISSDSLTLDGIDLKIKILFDRMFGCVCVCVWYDFSASMQASKRTCTITLKSSIEFSTTS